MKTTTTIILTLLALLFLQRECTRPPVHPPVPDTIRTSDTIFDTILLTKTIERPKTFYVIDSFEYQTIVDTAAIIRDFISLKIVNRVLMDDTVAYIGITDSLTRNSLLGATLEYKNRRPTIIENITVIHPPPPQRFQLYAGGFLQSAIRNPQSEIIPTHPSALQ